MSEELQQRIENFQDEYLNVPEGQKHLAKSETEPSEGEEPAVVLGARTRAGAGGVLRPR